MNAPVINESPKGIEHDLTKTCVIRPSRSLVWAITTGEAILWGTLAWFFADYWQMLPVRFRVGGIVFLATLAGIGLFRLVRFYHRLPRVDRAGMKTRGRGRRSD